MLKTNRKITNISLKTSLSKIKYYISFSTILRIHFCRSNFDKYLLFIQEIQEKPANGDE